MGRIIHTVVRHGTDSNADLINHYANERESKSLQSGWIWKLNGRHESKTFHDLRVRRYLSD